MWRSYENGFHEKEVVLQAGQRSEWHNQSLKGVWCQNGHVQKLSTCKHFYPQPTSTILKIQATSGTWVECHRRYSQVFWELVRLRPGWWVPTIAAQQAILTMQVVLIITSIYLRDSARDDQAPMLLRDVSGKLWFDVALAGVSVLLALLFIAPYSHTFRHFPIDFLLGCAWIAAFVFLLLEFKGKSNCNQSVSDLATMTLPSICHTAQAAYAFAFLSACLWLTSSVVGAWICWRDRRQAKKSSIANMIPRSSSRGWWTLRYVSKREVAYALVSAVAEAGDQGH